MQNKTISARIYGVVQGVCFREYTRRKAVELDLVGWVKNRPDGSVEALVSGIPERVDQMVHWLHSGSPASSVQRVEITENQSVSTPSSFRIAY